MRIQIFGTDLSESVIEHARLGIYSSAIEKDVSPSGDTVTVAVPVGNLVVDWSRVVSTPSDAIVACSRVARR